MKKRTFRKKWSIDKILSQQEATVAILIYKEYSTEKIANLLHIAPATVKAHILHLRNKLGVCSKSGISAYIGYKVGYLEGYKNAFRN